MNTHTYLVKLSGNSPTVVQITQLECTVIATNTVQAERTLNNRLSVMFKGDPAVDWTYTLIDYARQPAS